MPKELPEDQKVDADPKAKGKAPAKDAKGKGAAKEEEISPEEQERLDREKAEKEEKERKLQEEWDQLDEETKHIRTSEDIFKEPCIKMANEVNINLCEKL